MRLANIIESGAKHAGSVAALGRIIDLSREATSAAKSEKRPLPTEACFKLSEYLEIDPTVVIALNEMVGEHDEDKLKYWNEYLAKKDMSYINSIICLI